jgi:hypothetical protein
VACENSSSWNASRKLMSDACRCRIRYSTASAGVTWSSPGVRKAVVRADTSVDSEAMPGVSMRVICRSDDDGHSMTSRLTSPASVPPRSMVMAPPSRVNGTWRASPCFGSSVAR